MTNVTALRSSVRPSPVFLFIVGVFALSGLAVWRYDMEGTAHGAVRPVRVRGGGWIVSLCLHEFGHAFFAYRSGDHSVATKGYLTLNPLKYGDMALSFILPVLFVLLGGIGLPGGAVYIDRGGDPGADPAQPDLGGRPARRTSSSRSSSALLITTLRRASPTCCSGPAAAFLAFLQVTAAVLNLLPVPGLDGFGIVEPYLPRHWVREADQISGYAFMALLALLWIPAVNREFFSVVYHLTDLFGIDNRFTDVGYLLFRFWQR